MSATSALAVGGEVAEVAIELFLARRLDAQPSLNCGRRSVGRQQDAAGESVEVAEAQRAISLAKGRLDPFPLSAEDSAEREGAALAAIWRRYEERLARSDALDFDDLISRAFELLRDHPDVRTHVQARHRFVLVDEYQDANRAQAEWLRLLAEEPRAAEDGASRTARGRRAGLRRPRATRRRSVPRGRG